MAQALTTPLSQAWTVCLADGTPVAFTGIACPWPGFGVLWLVCTSQAQFAPRGTVRTLRHLWEQEHTGYRRIESIVVGDSWRAHRLHTWFGFTYAQEKKGYGPGGETAYEYVWVKECA